MSASTMVSPVADAPALTVAPKKARDPRMGLRTSATFATIFTILGHTVFGFEQSRDFDRAVTVGVCFDDGHHLDRGPDRVADGSEIVPDRGARDLNPATHGPTA